MLPGDNSRVVSSGSQFFSVKNLARKLRGGEKMLAATFFFGGVILGIIVVIAQIKIPRFRSDWDQFKANAWLLPLPIAAILIAIGFYLSSGGQALWLGK